MIGTALESAARWVVHASWQAAVLAVVVGLIRAGCGRRLEPRWRYALWAVVVARLLMPIGVSSRVSLWNWVRIAPSAVAWHMTEPSLSSHTNNLEREHATAGHGTLIPSGEGHLIEVSAFQQERAPHVLVWLVVGWVWLVVAVLLSGRLIGASLVVWHRVRAMPRSENPQLLALVRACAAELAITHPPAVIDAPAGMFPLLVGLWRPALLLPVNLPEQLDDRQIRLVILHELMHQRRHDVAANWLLSLLAAMHWFNPVLWWAFRWIRIDRELACDAAVIRRATLAERRTYAQLILNLVESLSRRELPAGAVGICEDGRQIKRRLAMIMHPGSVSRRTTVLAALLALAAGAITLTQATRGQDKSDKATTRPVEGGETLSSASDMQAIYSQREREDRDLNSQTATKLGKTLTDFQFDQVPLETALATWADRTGIDINVKWKAMEAANVDKMTPVSLKARSVTAARGLEIILESAAGDGAKLDYGLDAGIVRISTADDLAKFACTEVYDVHELMGNINGEALETKMGALIKLIQDSIATDSWRDNGGTVGALRSFDDKLIITQLVRNQWQIASLLEKLKGKKQ